MNNIMPLNEAKASINPKKIKEARMARGFNITELAEKVGVTRQTISKYECGELNPSAIVLRKISEALNLPFSFFSKNETIKNQDIGTTFFRSLRSTEAYARDIIKTKAKWVVEIFSELSNHLKLPPPNLPYLEKFSNVSDYSFDNIEEIAVELRKAWGIGLGPISNLTYLLEKNGFVISQMFIGNDKMDACSHKISGRPFIFLVKDKQAAVRTRFDLAHELGHMLLHSYIDETELHDKKNLDKVEREANHFASAFLFPSEKFMSELLSMSLDHLISLKSRWLISIKALIYRCGDLGLLTENQRLYLYKQISMKKWNKKEPLDDQLQCETPTIFKTCISMLIDKGVITKEYLLDVFRLNPDDIKELCSLPENFWESNNSVIKIDFINKK